MKEQVQGTSPRSPHCGPTSPRSPRAVEAKTAATWAAAQMTEGRLDAVERLIRDEQVSDRCLIGVR